MNKSNNNIKTKREVWRRFIYYMKANYDLYLFLLPAVIALILFSYWPIYGIQIAFRDYRPKLGFTGSTWVGLKHFKRFISSTYFPVVMKNTLTLSLYQLVAGFPIPIIFALLLNSMKGKRYRKLIQTVTYAPNFISVVVLCGMVILYLSPRVGVFNLIIEALGGEKVNFMAKPEYFKSIYVWSGIWQTMGWNSIIYFAALSGISPELHEAAIMDGASKWKRILHVDLPGIMPTIVILLILSFGSLMSVGFEKVFLLQNDQNIASSETIATYVYKMGLVNNDISFSTAIGLFNSVINLTLLTVVNFISRKLSNNSLW
jgi:putative aldouronate transport system permease protein